MSSFDQRRALLIERIEKLAEKNQQAQELLDLLEGESLIAQSSAVSVEDATQVSYAKAWETIEDDRHRVRVRFSRWAQKLRLAEGLEESNYEALATAWGQLCLQTATYEVEVYRGAALRDWYIEFGEGGLGSCMTGYDAEEYTALYSEHPRQVGLVIAFRDGRPKARALLWTGLTHPLNSQSVDFLDRIYFVEESAARWLENWATVEGKGLRFPINDTEIQISLGGSLIGNFYVPIDWSGDPSDYCWPYLDTLCFLRESDGGWWLCNSKDSATIAKLRCTDGGYIDV